MKGYVLQFLQIPSSINFSLFFFFFEKNPQPQLFLLSYLGSLQYLQSTATINASSISFAGNHIDHFTQLYENS